MTKEEYFSTINLLDDWVYILNFWDRIVLLIVKFGRYFLMMLELGVVLMFFVHLVYDSKIASTRDKIEQYIAAIKQLSEQEHQIRDMQTTLSELSYIISHRYSMYELNRRIYELLPEGIELKQVNLIKLRADIIAVASNYDSITEFIRILRNSPWIEKKSIQAFSNQRPDGKITLQVSFNFTAQ